MNILEFNPDGTTLGDGVYLVNMRLLVAVDGDRTWHYYGTLVPGPTVGGVPTMQHSAVEVQLDTESIIDAVLMTAKEQATNEL